ncbi:MAG TPA: hypothetical protein VNS09_23830 [Solirubrobacter sp.]|nr:hypothetical protein [Solirubrobacter sp.]
MDAALGLLLAALALLALAAPTTASAAPSLEIGLQDDNVFLRQYYFGREQGLQAARRLGVTRLRVNVRWATLLEKPNARSEPATRSYDWAAFDSLIEDASREGIKLQLALTGPAPAWATQNRRVGVRAPKAAAYGRFVRDVARHFKGRIDRYSIWNEPNWHTQLEPAVTCRKRHWKPGCDARLASRYRALYSAGYRAIKTTDPHAQVLFGELSPSASGTRKQPTAFSTAPLAFLRGVTCSTPTWTRARKCAPLKADGFAHHPYAFRTPPNRLVGAADDVTLASLDRLTHALDKLARRRALRTPTGRPMPLYLTEYGYLQPPLKGLSEPIRARYLTQSFDRALRHPRVRQLLQYLLVAPPPENDTFRSQIINADGTHTRSFGALERWATLHAPRLTAAP